MKKVSNFEDHAKKFYSDKTVYFYNMEKNIYCRASKLNVKVFNIFYKSGGLYIWITWEYFLFAYLEIITELIMNIIYEIKNIM